MPPALGRPQRTRSSWSPSLARTSCGARAPVFPTHTMDVPALTGGLRRACLLRALIRAKRTARLANGNLAHPCRTPPRPAPRSPFFATRLRARRSGRHWEVAGAGCLASPGGEVAPWRPGVGREGPSQSRSEAPPAPEGGPTALVGSELGGLHLASKNNYLAIRATSREGSDRNPDGGKHFGSLKGTATCLCGIEHILHDVSTQLD